MAAEPPLAEKIRQNAELVIQIMGDMADMHLDYSLESVKKIEDYIERIRLSVSEETAWQLSNNLGAFFGECIRHHYGGEWQIVNEQPGLVMANGITAFPFNKVQKLFIGGLEDGESLVGFYNAIAVVPKILEEQDKPDSQFSDN
jgi:hypothetical protein